LRPSAPLLTQLRALDSEELRNETLALLLAGHETTANALSWTFALIGEMDCDPKAAVQEAMRLFPPIWVVERRAISHDEVGGFEINADNIVYISPYILHRHRDFWRDPEHFDPSRFPEAAQNAAYLPFGTGPHHCLGAAFAMAEAPLVIETVRRRCVVTIDPDARIEPQPWITLRPRHGVPARIRRR
jgi:cytochrome P450